MFKTIPYIAEKVWGYERWIVSTHEVGQSMIDTSVDVIGGKKINEVVGENYPLLIKIIQANQTLSVQVHPGDEYAKRVENTYGKTECWYILDAEKNASLVCGLKKKYTQKELERLISKNEFEDCLRYVPVQKGDFVFIPAGTVHSIQGGLRILELQEPSDITYRLYDWGRKREMHVKKGLEVINCETPNVVKNFSGMFNCKYFKLEKVRVGIDTKITFDESVQDQEGKPQKTPAGKTGWVSFFVLSGTADIVSNHGEKLSVKAEDSVMVRVSEILTFTKVDNFSIMKMM